MYAKCVLSVLGVLRCVRVCVGVFVRVWTYVCVRSRVRVCVCGCGCVCAKYERVCVLSTW